LKSFAMAACMLRGCLSRGVPKASVMPFSTDHAGDRGLFQGGYGTDGRPLEGEVKLVEPGLQIAAAAPQ
jgi:hypothetical protein